jgi:hypothetical protein
MKIKSDIAWKILIQLTKQATLQGFIDSHAERMNRKQNEQILGKIKDFIKENKISSKQFINEYITERKTSCYNVLHDNTLSASIKIYFYKRKKYQRKQKSLLKFL